MPCHYFERLRPIICILQERSAFMADTRWWTFLPSTAYAQCMLRRNAMLFDQSVREDPKTPVGCYAQKFGERRDLGTEVW